MSYYILKRRATSTGEDLPPSGEDPVAVGTYLSPIAPGVGIKQKAPQDDYRVIMAKLARQKIDEHVVDPRKGIHALSAGKPLSKVSMRKDIEQISKHIRPPRSGRNEIKRLQKDIESLIDTRDSIDALLRDPSIFTEDLRTIIVALTGEGFSWMVLRRIDRTTDCSCKVEETISTENCGKCLGLGHPFADRLVKGYMWMGLFGFEFNATPGVLSTQRRNVVLEYTRPVNKFDQILSLSLNPDTGEPNQPFRIQRLFSVQDSIPVRGKGGRVEFWKAVVEERSLSDGRGGEDGTGYKPNTFGK